MANSLWSLLAEAARVDPSGVAVVEDGRSSTWAETHRRAASLGAFLQRVGLEPGDRVAALLPNRSTYLEAYFAAAGSGLVLVPLNTRLAPAELRDILIHGGVRHVLADAAFESTVSLLRRDGCLSSVTWLGGTPALDGAGGLRLETPQDAFDCPLDVVSRVSTDVAQLYYTSGTTGRPKGVMLTHGNVLAHARAACEELSLTGQDVWAHIAPLFHLADAWAVFAITAVRGRHAMLPRFDPEDALRLLASERVTITNLVPTMLNLMVKSPTAESVDLSSVRTIMSGGAPISRDLVRRVLSVFGGEYVQTYGMTETSPYLTLGLLPPGIAALPPDERLIWQARTGRPFKAIDLRVVDDDGREVPEDGRTAGEIQVRGATVTPGYWDDPAATAEAFVEGWLKTGDLAVRFGHGFIDIVDRKKDVIISGGETIYSTEVENALYDHAGILEAAAFGVPDPVWGEIVAAAIVPRPGCLLEPNALDTFCRARIAGYKVPRRWQFLDSLPKTGSGKIAKRLLRTERFKAP